ncbi:MAG: ATP-binding protein [Paracoccaceae bacterium]
MLAAQTGIAQSDSAPSGVDVTTVLVLLSGSADNSLENEFLAGLSARMREADGTDGSVVSLHVEFLDLLRSDDPDAAIADWQDRLTRKYREIDLDAVVVHRRPALALVLGQTTVGTRIPIIHAGLSPTELATVRLPAQATGVAASWDIRGTIQLSRHLFPQARNIAVVAGSTQLETELVAQAEAAILALEPAAQPIDLRGLDWPQLQERMASLPPNTVIVGISMALDARGRVVDQMQALKRGAEIANAPIFTLSPVSVGMGSVGGSILDLRAVGADAADRVLATLQDRPLPSPPPAAFVSVKLDARALARWNVPTALVPPDAEILFEAPDLWRDFPGQVILMALTLSILSVLAIGLIIERRLRRLAEDAAKSRLAQIARMNRVSSMGHLSASIAHEVNQPLGAVQNYAEGAERLLAASPLPMDKLKLALHAIRTESQRASDRIARVRGLFTAADAPLERLDLNTVTAQTVTMASAEAERRQIVLEVALFQAELPIQGDDVQLQQVILNLILNGLDACSARTGGKVVVTTLSSQSGPVLQVADNGAGLDAASATRLFEPFFTTKEHGMGIGLSIVRSIIDAHRGRIGVRSTGPVGTCMEITLPFSNDGTRTDVLR